MDMLPESSEPQDITPSEDGIEELSDVEKGAIESVSMEYRFYESSRQAIGDDEYKTDPEFWRAQFQRDFQVIEERLKMEQEALIEGKIVAEANLDDLVVVEFHWERLGGLRVVSLEQFILESNQGIFREDRFYCDKGRGWFKKTAQILSEYGYIYVRKVEVETRLLLEVSRNPMGEF